MNQSKFDLQAMKSISEFHKIIKNYLKMKQIIKKLTWIKNVMDDPIAVTPFGYYYIDQAKVIYECIWITGKGKTESIGNGTIEQVKELCQNHFESLINQCLE